MSAAAPLRIHGAALERGGRELWARGARHGETTQHGAGRTPPPAAHNSHPTTPARSAARPAPTPPPGAAAPAAPPPLAS